MKKETVLTVLALIIMVVCFALAGRIDTWFLANGIIH